MRLGGYVITTVGPLAPSHLHWLAPDHRGERRQALLAVKEQAHVLERIALLRDR
jgi:hypothetical protein